MGTPVRSYRVTSPLLEGSASLATPKLETPVSEPRPGPRPQEAVGIHSSALSTESAAKGQTAAAQALELLLTSTDWWMPRRADLPCPSSSWAAKGLFWACRILLQGGRTLSQGIGGPDLDFEIIQVLHVSHIG